MARIPNILTVSRILLSPVFLIVFLFRTPGASLAALLMVLFFELSDFLDGHIARRYQVVSTFGKLFDPMADRLAHYAVFFAFLTEPFVSRQPWVVILVFILFARDTAVTYIRMYAASRGVVLAARASGKLKTAVQGLGITIYMIVRTAALGGLEQALKLEYLFYAVMGPIVLVSVASFFDYLKANRHLLSSADNE